MLALHITLGILLVALNLVVGVAGLVYASRRGSASRAVSHGLAFGQSIVLAQGIVGLLLLGAGDPADDPLHARVYGPFMVVALAVAYGFRSPDTRRNLQVFSGAALIVAALGVRAMQTG